MLDNMLELIFLPFVLPLLAFSERETINQHSIFWLRFQIGLFEPETIKVQPLVFFALPYLHVCAVVKVLWPVLLQVFR